MMRAALIAISWLAAALLIATPASSQVLPGTKLYLKNNTGQTLRCTLAADAAPARAIRLKPGKEFTDTYPRTARLSVTCPKLRPAPFGPLQLGTHYSFLKFDGRTDLIEVSPATP